MISGLPRMTKEKQEHHLLPSEIILAMPESSRTASRTMIASPNSSRRATADASSSPAQADAHQRSFHRPASGQWSLFRAIPSSLQTFRNSALATQAHDEAVCQLW